MKARGPAIKGILDHVICVDPEFQVGVIGSYWHQVDSNTTAE